MRTAEDETPQEQLRWNSLLVSLEYRGGEERNERVLPNDWMGYGYIQGIEAVDGDSLDIIIGPGGVEDGTAYLAWQTDPEGHGEFVQWKVMVGFSDEDAAREGFLALWPEHMLGGVEEVSPELLAQMITAEPLNVTAADVRAAPITVTAADVVAYHRDVVKPKEIKQWSTDDVSYAIFSSHTTKQTISQTKADYQALLQRLTKLGYDPKRLRGKWEETRQRRFSDETRMRPEPSLLVRSLPFEEAIALGREYNQDAIIYKDETGVVGMYNLKTQTVRVPEADGQPVFGEEAVVAQEGKSKKGPGVKPEHPGYKAPPESDLYTRGKGSSFEFKYNWNDERSVLPFGQEPVTRDMVERHYEPPKETPPSEVEEDTGTGHSGRRMAKGDDGRARRAPARAAVGEDGRGGFISVVAKDVTGDPRVEDMGSVGKPPVHVYFVDGNMVRDSIDVDFVEGGNHGRYPDYVPEDEIWVEAVLTPEDQSATIVHEYTERALMLHGGMEYDQAHEQADVAEREYRAQWADADDIMADAHVFLKGRSTEKVAVVVDAPVTWHDDVVMEDRVTDEFSLDTQETPQNRPEYPLVNLSWEKFAEQTYPDEYKALLHHRRELALTEKELRARPQNEQLKRYLAAEKLATEFAERMLKEKCKPPETLPSSGVFKVTPEWTQRQPYARWAERPHQMIEVTAADLTAATYEEPFDLSEPLDAPVMTPAPDTARGLRRTLRPSVTDPTRLVPAHEPLPEVDAPFDESDFEDELPDPSDARWKTKVKKLVEPEPSPVPPGLLPFELPSSPGALKGAHALYRKYQKAVGAVEAYRLAVEGQKKTPEMNAKQKELLLVVDAAQDALEVLVGPEGVERLREVEEGKKPKRHENDTARGLYVDQPAEEFKPTQMPPKDPDVRFNSMKSLGVTPNDEARDSARGVQNIMAVYNSSANPQVKYGNREYGATWYATAHNDAAKLGEQHPINGKPVPREVVAAVIAATSPNTKWQVNLKAAQQILRGYGREVLKAAANEDYAAEEFALAAIFPGMYSDPVSLGGGIYNKNVAKAQAIYDAWEKHGSLPTIVVGEKKNGTDFFEFPDVESAMEAAVKYKRGGAQLYAGRLTDEGTIAVMLQGQLQEPHEEAPERGIRAPADPELPFTREREKQADKAEAEAEAKPEKKPKKELPPLKDIFEEIKRYKKEEKKKPKPVRLSRANIVIKGKKGRTKIGFWVQSALGGKKVNSFFANINNTPRPRAEAEVEKAQAAVAKAKSAKAKKLAMEVLERAQTTLDLSIASERNPTIDGHAFNIWRGAIESLSDETTVPGALYGRIQQDYIKAGSMVDPPLTGQAMQAITWCQWRNMLDQRKKKEKLEGAEAVMEPGVITTVKEKKTKKKKETPAVETVESTSTKKVDAFITVTAVDVKSVPDMTEKPPHDFVYDEARGVWHHYYDPQETWTPRQIEVVELAGVPVAQGSAFRIGPEGFNTTDHWLDADASLWIVEVYKGLLIRTSTDYDSMYVSFEDFEKGLREGAIVPEPNGNLTVTAEDVRPFEMGLRQAAEVGGPITVTTADIEVPCIDRTGAWGKPKSKVSYEYFEQECRVIETQCKLMGQLEEQFYQAYKKSKAARDRGTEDEEANAEYQELLPRISKLPSTVWLKGELQDLFRKYPEYAARYGAVGALSIAEPAHGLSVSDEPGGLSDADGRTGSILVTAAEVKAKRRPRKEKRRRFVGETYFYEKDGKIGYATSELAGPNAVELRLAPTANVLREGDEIMIELEERGASLDEIMAAAMERGYDAVRVKDRMALLNENAVADRMPARRPGWAKAGAHTHDGKPTDEELQAEYEAAQQDARDAEAAFSTKYGHDSFDVVYIARMPTTRNAAPDEPSKAQCLEWIETPEYKRTMRTRERAMDAFEALTKRRFIEVTAAQVRTAGIGLVHYSTTPGLTVIDPKFIGSGQLSTRERQDKRVPVSFYYFAGTEPESLLLSTAKARYEAEIPETAKVLDLADDLDWVYEANRKDGRGGMYGAIRDAGYFGFFNSQSALPNAFLTFYALPVVETDKNKDRRTVAILKYKAELSAQQAEDIVVGTWERAHGLSTSLTSDDSAELAEDNDDAELRA